MSLLQFHTISIMLQKQKHKGGKACGISCSFAQFPSVLMHFIAHFSNQREGDEIRRLSHLS